MHTDQIKTIWLAACLLLTGCASLSAHDYTVMQEALKEEASQAQRIAANLHAQVQTLQEQLGAARAAQARHQGELLDSERRVIEAQRVAELKRDELAKAKEDREQLAIVSNKLQAQVTELERLRQRVVDANREQKRIKMLQASIKKLMEEVATLNMTVRDSLGKARPSAVSAEPVDARPAEPMPPLRSLIVRAGDTLFSIARKYAVALEDLKNHNGLTTDRILVGQVLVVPDP